MVQPKVRVEYVLGGRAPTPAFARAHSYGRARARARAKERVGGLDRVSGSSRIVHEEVVEPWEARKGSSLVLCLCSIVVARLQNGHAPFER